MARDFISITPTAPQAQLLIQAKQSCRQSYELLQRCLAIMGHMNDGVVFTDIETYFGVPAGKGQTVFNYVNGAFGTMNATFQTADVKNFTEDVG